MSAWQTGAAIAMGLVVNEFTELCPWAGRKLVQWSARHSYLDPRRAAERAEELAGLIDDRPGKLLKLFTGLGFAGAAIVRPRIRRALAPSSVPVSWRPSALTRPPLGEFEPSGGGAGWSARVDPMQSAWDEIRRTVDAVPTPGHRPPRGGPRRKLRKLAKITGDDRWLTLAANVKLLSDPQEWCYGTKYTMPIKANPGGYRVANRIPTRGAWLDYLKAAEEVRRDLAVLAGGLDTSP